jgi:hypothetical protein
MGERKAVSPFEKEQADPLIGSPSRGRAHFRTDSKNLQAVQSFEFPNQNLKNKMNMSSRIDTQIYEDEVDSMKNSKYESSEIQMKSSF